MDYFQTSQGVGWKKLTHKHTSPHFTGEYNLHLITHKGTPELHQQMFIEDKHIQARLSGLIAQAYAWR